MYALQRNMKLHRQDQSEWWEILQKLQYMLRTASKELFACEMMSKSAMDKYHISGKTITHTDTFTK